MVTVGEVAGYIEKLAPLALAESWDRVGLQVGRAGDEVKRLLVCLDVTAEVVSRAVETECRMIVSHHPLFFGDFTGLTEADAAGRLGLRLAEEGINLYVSHTNLDKAPGGINDALAAVFGLADVRVIESAGRLLKLVVFVPKAALAAVRKALGDAGAGVIGLYSHCSFSQPGIGAFRPMPGARPSEGEVGKDNRVEEYRLEVEVSPADLNRVLEAMSAVHPYEEVAFDIYELQNEDRRYGLGRVGELADGMSLEAFVEVCRERVSRGLRVAGPAESMVNRVAVCGGSGASVIERAAAAGAEVLVTGDIKYHDAQKALRLGLAIIDAGHDATELVGLGELASRLAADLDVEVQGAEAPGPYLIWW